VSAPGEPRTCARQGCGFSNPPQADRCHACGHLLGPQGPTLTPPPPVAHSGGGYLKTVTGNVTAGPQRTEVMVVRALVPTVICLVALVIVANVGHLLVSLLLPVLILSLLVHLIRQKRHSFGFADVLGANVLARRVRRSATNPGTFRKRTQSETFRVKAAHNGAVWSVTFLPRTVGQLLMGDPVTLLARSAATGELDALWVKNNRTGVTIQSSRIIDRVLATSAAIGILNAQTV
jgi:hypothetical protein